MSTESGANNKEMPKEGTKCLRSQEPDVVVVVGSGVKKEEFHCYRLNLSFASEVFDAMFCSGMKENETGKILLPDKDPNEWRLFYEFFDPATVHNARVTDANVETLTPWFHHFQMMRLLENCDEIVCEIIKELNLELIDAKTQFNDMLPYLEMSVRYNLESARAMASGSFKSCYGNLLS